jgi:hypothetical protein
MAKSEITITYKITWVRRAIRICCVVFPVKWVIKKLSKMTICKIYQDGKLIEKWTYEDLYEEIK